MIFYSLQGLGNSVINFPLLAHLRRDRAVRVVAFENGSADFFRAFHADVIGVRSNARLIRAALGLYADEIFVCAPTWRRELAALTLTRARRKLFVRPRGPLGYALRAGAPPNAEVHDFENNVRALNASGPVDATLSSLVVGAASRGPRVLGLHPTASTPIKYYPVKFWRELIASLSPSYDAVEMYCGPKDDEIAFCREIGSVPIHAGLPFRELVPRLNALTDFVGHDSALMHLAAMLGRPTVGLWSYADYRRIYPYGDDARIYVPRETLETSNFEAPPDRPSFLARARAADVVAIVRREREAPRSLARASGPAVGVHAY